MLLINGITVDYNNLYVYEGENILFHTCRPYDLNIEINDLPIRNARKVDFNKGDVFEVKAPKNEDGFMRNGKDLYIPSSIISVKSEGEKLMLNANGEKDYKTIYVLGFNCEAFRWEKHIEKVTDLPHDKSLEEYDKEGKWSSGFSKECNTYEVSTHPKTGETVIFKRYLTYDKKTEITVESDFYTRTEKDTDRIEREKIAEIISECLYSKNTTVSHYEVAAMLKKLNISIKE